MYFILHNITLLIYTALASFNNPLHQSDQGLRSTQPVHSDRRGVWCAM